MDSRLCCLSRPCRHEEDPLQPSTTEATEIISEAVTSSTGGFLSQRSYGSRAPSQGTTQRDKRPLHSSSSGLRPSQSNVNAAGEPSQSSNAGEGPSESDTEGRAPRRTPTGGKTPSRISAEGTVPNHSPNEELDPDIEALGVTECTICFEPFDHYEKKRALIRPCGHGMICLSCAMKLFLTSMRCPMCRLNMCSIVFELGKITNTCTVMCVEYSYEGLFHLSSSS